MDFGKDSVKVFEMREITTANQQNVDKEYSDPLASGVDGGSLPP